MIHRVVAVSSGGLATACAVPCVAAQNVFQLLNDADSAAARTVAPGQAVIAANSQSTLGRDGSSMQVVGTTFTLLMNKRDSERTYPECTTALWILVASWLRVELYQPPRKAQCHNLSTVHAL